MGTRRIVAGDTVVRHSWPHETGDVTEAREFTVVVRWASGTEEEIDRAAVRRAGTVAGAPFPYDHNPHGERRRLLFQPGGYRVRRHDNPSESDE